MRAYAYCEFGKHPCLTEEDGSMHGYRDASNGIPEIISICARHLLVHLREHYPNSSLTQAVYDYNFGDKKP